MCKVQTCPSIFIGRESDHWLPLSITDSLLLSKLDLCVCVKLPTQNLLGLLLLLMLVMKIVLATDLEAEVWSSSLTFVQTLSTLVKILKLKLRRDFDAEIWTEFCC